ncbi:MAG: transketolase [Candidatus Nomurabacteria bacterium]|nr:transketolase [Candidatus Nomurabacteria bacterium]
METIKDETIKELKIKANDIRKSIVEMLYLAGSGHTAGALGMADVFTYLYFNALRHKPENPYWLERDRLVLSNGHICPVLYATMAHAGYFKIEELKTLRKFGSHLQGHPHREFLPIVDTSSGPLGEGLSQAVGMAIASRMDNGVDKTIYCIVGDGELNEGQNWEAIMLGAKYKLDNLIVIVDRNFIQIDGTTEEVMPLSVLEDKWKSFNWDVQKINENDFREINHAIYHAKNTKWKPSVIIANTIPGKGVKEWENDYKWHGIAPNKDQYEMAIKELNMRGDKLK